MARRRVGAYRDAVEWIAYNDDTEWVDGWETNKLPSVSVCLVADVFGRTREETGNDVARLVRKRWNSAA